VDILEVIIRNLQRIPELFHSDDPAQHAQAKRLARNAYNWIGIALLSSEEKARLTQAASAIKGQISPTGSPDQILSWAWLHGWSGGHFADNTSSMWHGIITPAPLGGVLLQCIALETEDGITDVDYQMRQDVLRALTAA